MTIRERMTLLEANWNREMNELRVGIEDFQNHALRISNWRASQRKTTVRFAVLTFF